MKSVPFREKLIEVRKAKGLTQEDVATLCRITSRTIQRIESGAVTPRPYTIKLISEVLGFDYFESTDKHLTKEEQPANKEHSSFFKNKFQLNKKFMKKTFIIGSLVIITGVLFMVLPSGKAQNQFTKDLLFGKWQLCNIDGTVCNNLHGEDGHCRFKIFTDNTFIVFETTKENNVCHAFFHGKYQKRNNEYSETIEFADGCLSQTISTSNTFSYVLKDDLLYLKGINNNYNEIWKKVD